MGHHAVAVDIGLEKHCIDHLYDHKNQQHQAQQGQGDGGKIYGQVGGDGIAQAKADRDQWTDIRDDVEHARKQPDNKGLLGSEADDIGS